jgi:hypothetical protein
MVEMEKVQFGGIQWKKMYDINNCPSDFELQNMKEKLLEEIEKII